MYHRLPAINPEMLINLPEKYLIAIQAELDGSMQAFREGAIGVLDAVEDRWKEGSKIPSLAEAKKSEAHMIMEGDWGGQIYLSVPASMIKCSEATLKQLLQELDRHEWDCNDGKGARIWYEKMNSGDQILGGGYGGLATKGGLWIHEDLEILKIRIMEVLNGKRSSIIDYQ